MKQCLKCGGLYGTVEGELIAGTPCLCPKPPSAGTEVGRIPQVPQPLSASAEDGHHTTAVYQDIGEWVQAVEGPFESSDAAIDYLRQRLATPVGVARERDTNVEQLKKAGNDLYVAVNDLCDGIEPTPEQRSALLQAWGNAVFAPVKIAAEPVHGEGLLNEIHTGRVAVASESRAGAASPRHFLPENSTIVPKQPSAALLASMGMRYRHDFGLLDPEMQAGICSTMRQLYEEATGQGFFKFEPNPSTGSKLVWVIEKGSPAQYFFGFDYGAGKWTPNFAEALAVPNREAMQDLWDCDVPLFTIFNDDCRIADHIICDAPRERAPEGGFIK